MLAGNIVELLEIKACRGAPDSLEIEPFNGLFGGKKLIISMAPAKPGQIVPHGFGQIAHRAILFDAEGAVAF